MDTDKRRNNGLRNGGWLSLSKPRMYPLGFDKLNQC